MGSCGSAYRKSALPNTLCPPLTPQQGRPPPRRGGPELCRVKMESGKPGNLGFLSWFLTVEIWSQNESMEQNTSVCVGGGGRIGQGAQGVNTAVFASVCSCRWMWWRPRVNLNVFPQELSSWGFSGTWGSPIMLSWLASKPQGSIASPTSCPRTGIISTGHHV